MIRDTIAVLDFGGQYAHLIAKRIRHLGVYTVICSPMTATCQLQSMKGIVLSGGPASVFAHDAPAFNEKILSLDLPILGLCYGHQLIAQYYGGTIRNTGMAEFGKTFVDANASSPLWADIAFPSQVWMSHQDSVTVPPPNFEVIGHTAECAVVALQHNKRRIYTLQFHPEVSDSEQGAQMLANFIKQCGAQAGWSMENFIRDIIFEIHETVRSRKILMFLSGGVDSSVTFALLNKALGKQRVWGLFIDNGFLRKNEAGDIRERYHQLGFDNVSFRDASEDFLNALKDRVDPQQKRKLVGAMFIQIRNHFLRQAKLDPAQWMLGQGTLYPDIIESGGTEHAQVIKSHHNRVQEIEDLLAEGHVVEPLKDLYKDEVRKIAKLLGLPDSIVWRHPFPGPGLSISVLCAHGDEVFENMAFLCDKLSKVIASYPYEADLLPVRSVGVQGDLRTYTQPAVLSGPLDWNLLEQTSIRITNELRAINRVVLLLSPARLPPLKIRKAYCTRERLDLLRSADAIATQTFAAHDLMRQIFQLLVIILPLSVKGTGNCIVLRPVCSEDVMTAQFAKVDWNILKPLAEQIFELPGIEAVFYDVTHKPPATFGWE